MRDQQFHSATVVAGARSDGLTRLVSIERLLGAPQARAVAEVMDVEPPVVAPGMLRNKLPRAAIKHGEVAVGVAIQRPLSTVIAVLVVFIGLRLRC